MYLLRKVYNHRFEKYAAETVEIKCLSLQVHYPIGFDFSHNEAEVLMWWKQAEYVIYHIYEIVVLVASGFHVVKHCIG